MKPSLLSLCLLMILATLSPFAVDISAGFSHHNQETGRARAIDLVNDFIKSQKKRVWVLAYEITNPTIIQLLKDMAKKGLDVRVIHDNKASLRNKALATEFAQAGVIYRRNAAFAIMHNKVIIGDDGNLLTGSFNFSKAAVDRNAENVLVLKAMPLEVWRQYEAEFKLLEKESK